MGYYRDSFQVAHLILAHNVPDHLFRLVERLRRPDAHIFIHVDAKSDISPYRIQFADYPDVHLIQKRTKANWGGFSLVQATLDSLIEIQASGKPFTYVNLLSGSDYPIKPIRDFHSMLTRSMGLSFFEYEIEGTSWWDEAQPRLRNYHWVDCQFPGKNGLQALVNRITPSRTPPGRMAIVGRSQWFTVYAGHVRHILDFVRNNPAYVRFFRYTWGPDEFFFQTILYNSPYRDQLINDNLRYIDWSTGQPSPRVLTIDDAQLLHSSDKWFARKFDPQISGPLLDEIDSWITTEKTPITG